MAARGGGGGGGGGDASCSRAAAAVRAAALVEHRLRKQSVRRDTELALPPQLPLPDGEEFPHSANHIHIRTADQEKEIYEACIRPPPNRTMYARELWTSSDGVGGRGGVSSRLLANVAVSVSAPKCAPPAVLSTPVIRAESALTVVVPRHVRPPHGLHRPPQPAASTQLLEYGNGAGTRLADLRVVGCRTVAAPARTVATTRPPAPNSGQAVQPGRAVSPPAGLAPAQAVSSEDEVPDKTVPSDRLRSSDSSPVEEPAVSPTGLESAQMAPPAELECSQAVSPAELRHPKTVASAEQLRPATQAVAVAAVPAQPGPPADLRPQAAPVGVTSRQ